MIEQISSRSEPVVNVEVPTEPVTPPTEVAKLPLPLRSRVSDVGGSGLRSKEARKKASKRLKTQAEEVIRQEKVKVEQTSSPLNLNRIRKAIEKYRTFRGIE